jgi:hypothetical protein
MCSGKARDLYSGGARGNWTPTTRTEVLRVLSQLTQANSGILPPSGHHLFLPIHFKFIIHQPFYHSTIHSLEQ